MGMYSSELPRAMATKTDGKMGDITVTHPSIKNLFKKRKGGKRNDVNNQRGILIEK